MAEPGHEPWVLLGEGRIEPDAIVTLPADEARHLAGALRLGAGAVVVLADGAGTVARAELLSLGRGRAQSRPSEARVLEVERAPRPRAPRLELALGALHGQAMDWAVQKAVEQGVERLTPLLTARSQLSRTVAERRAAHWQRVAEQALKQCRRPWALELGAALSLDELVGTADGGALGLVADPGGASPADLAPRVAAAGSTVLVVGPEGGLVGDELALLERHGWQRICLARHVLRAETAAVAGVALLTWLSGLEMT